MTLLHTFAAPLTQLELGTPLRTLDAGMRRPMLFQLDGPEGAASWVVKAPHRERQQEIGLLFEIVGAELAAWLGIATPAIGITSFPSTPLTTDATEVGVSARDIYEKSAGRSAFCSRYLEGAPLVRAGDLDDLRSVPSSMREDAIRIFALDVLVRHYDRTPGNSNLLALNDRLVAIDHGLAFFRLGAVDETGLAVQADDQSDEPGLARHVAARLAGKQQDSAVWSQVAARVHALDDATLRAMLERAPAAFDRSPDGQALGMKDEIARFLRARRDAFDTILETVRACLSR
jgi:hypothetical protein